VLIPVELRRALAVEPGEPFLARVVDGQLVIERHADALRRVQARFTGLPAGTSLADELIADRRREAAKDLV
jgi:bifunctional DNA-binding transcriptional regulator/antitoxin component of YhaV-PrlF toxin-antitoxin module